MHIRVLRGLLNTVTFYTWFSLFQIKTMSALASRPFTFGNSWKNSCFSQTATAAVSSGSVDPRAYSKLKTPRESLGYGERGKIGRRWIMTNWADPFVSTTKRVSSRKQLIPSDSCISSVSHTCDWERKREREIGFWANHRGHLPQDVQITFGTWLMTKAIAWSINFC